MNSTNDDKKSKTPPQKNEESPAAIEDFIKDFRNKGISALSKLNKDKQSFLVNWAQDVVDQYGSVLTEHPMKIKNLVDLPCPKEYIKIAIKT